MAPFLTIYTQYCNNYEQSIASVERLKKQRASFAAYLTESNLHLQQSQNHFESLLITPIQRGPRYALLLKELLSRTNEGHPDYGNLKQSIAAVEKQINSVNKKIRESQALNEVVSIREKLVGDDIPNLVSPSRFYVNESSFKLCNLDSKGLSKEFESVHIFAFNDCLLYTKKQSTRAYKFRNIIPLGKDTRLKDIQDSGVVQNAFKLISPEKTISLVCHSAEHKKEWMDRIQSLQSDLLSKIQSQREEKAHTDGSLNVNATITGTKKLYDKSGKSFTCYSILVSPENDEPYTVYRRYREFDAIWRTLRKKFPDCNLMQLPKKHIIGNMKKDIVESRQIMLETFLDDILTKPEICASSELFIFLQPSDNYESTGGGIESKSLAKKKKKDERRGSVIKRRTTMSALSSKKSTDELPSMTKPLFVKKNAQNSLVELHKTSSQPDLQGFIPVLPPLPTSTQLRSSADRSNTPKKGLASSQKVTSSPKSNSSRMNRSPTVSQTTEPQKSKFAPKTASSSQITRAGSTASPKKPNLPPKPTEKDQSATTAAKPPLPPKPALEEMSPVTSPTMSPSRSRIRTVTVDKRKLSARNSGRSLPAPPPAVQ